MTSLGERGTNDSIPYRIRIGVTGHRTLPRPEVVSSLVSRVLDEEIEALLDPASVDQIRKAKNTPVLFSVISPLAEGADRLVAKEVLKHGGAILQAVLPLPVNEYVQDFESTESRQEFFDLLIRCRSPQRIKHLYSDDDLVTIEPAELRRHAYEAVGRHVVDHCDVLIAIWDGLPSRGRGGTAEIVAYAREHGRPYIRVWADDVGTVEVVKGRGLNISSIAGVELFNTFRIEPPGEAERYQANLDRDHFGREPGARIPEETKAAIREGLFSHYVKASLLAKRNQALYRRAGTCGYLLSAAAVASVAIAILFPAVATWAFSAELLILLSVSIIVGSAHRLRSAEKWIEARFLAERIRAAIYMAACGIEAATIQVPAHLGQAEHPDDWMVRVFDEIWNRMPRLPGCAAQECQFLAHYIAEHWIQDQITFHENKTRREGLWNVRLWKYGRALVVITMIAAALHLIISRGVESTGKREWIEKILTFVAIAFPALTGALFGLRSHREHLRLERRSANMVPRLRHMKNLILHTFDPASFEYVLRETESVMLDEAQDWLMLMRTATIEAA